MDTETEDFPVIELQYEDYFHQCDYLGEILIFFCTHPENPNNEEGNCTESLCPKMIKKHIKDDNLIYVGCNEVTKL